MHQCILCVVTAQSKAFSAPQAARSLGKASIAISITGIVISVVVAIIVTVLYYLAFSVATASAEEVSDSLLTEYYEQSHNTHTQQDSSICFTLTSL